MMDPSRQHDGSARMERLMRLASDPNLRWADVPGGANLLNQIALNPDDSDLAELAELLAQRQLQQARSSNDPYYANYPPAGQAVYMPDWICLGRMLTGSLVGLPPALHTSNFLSVGRTGAGKTTLTKQQALQLMRRGYCVVVVDRKRHWRQLAAQAHGQGEVVVLRLKELKVAVTQPPPAVDPSRWANDITRVFGQSYGRYSAHRPLSQVITEAVRTRRDNNWPGFDELTNGLLRMKFGRGSRGWDYRESMYWVLVDARQHLGDVFDCAASDMLEKMFSRPGLFVIEAEGLPTAHLGFLIAYFQQWAYCWHLAGRGAKRPIIFVLEDATSLADRQRDRETPGGVSLLGETMYLSRELQIGTILVVHDLGSLSQVIAKNVAGMVACGLQGDDVRRAGDLLGTTPEQSEMLRILQPGEAVGAFPSVWPQPLRFWFPRLDGAEVDEADLRRSAAGFLSELTVLPKPVRTKASPEEQSEPESEADSAANASGRHGGQLDADARRVLVLAETEVPPAQSRLYEQAGLSRRKGGKVVATLESRGLARRHRFSRTSRGGRITVLEVTARGRELMEQLGLATPRTAVTGGGWEHNLAASALRELGRFEGREVSFEVSVPGLRLDVVWSDSAGRRTGFQIGISDPEREAEALAGSSQLLTAVDTVVAVCRDKGFAKTLMAGLRRRESGLAKHLKVRLIGDLLDEVYRRREDKA